MKGVCALGVLLLLLSGCASGGLHCDGWKPIRPEKIDVSKISNSLAGQILAHNDYGQRVKCWTR